MNSIVCHQIIKSSNINNYNLQDLKQEVYACKEILGELGYLTYDKNYNVVFNTRAKNILGFCKKISDKNYQISINLNFLRCANPATIHDTIMHEVIHSIDGCMNHGRNFKKISEDVNQKLGYHISRTTTDNTYYANFLNNKQYIIYCKGCNKIVCKYMKKSPTWEKIHACNLQKSYVGFYCNNCKSHDLIAELASDISL